MVFDGTSSGLFDDFSSMFKFFFSLVFTEFRVVFQWFSIVFGEALWPVAHGDPGEHERPGTLRLDLPG